MADFVAEAIPAELGEAPPATEIAAWNELHRAAPPQELIVWASERWGDRLAFTCSFGGPAGMVLLDMLASVAPTTPVFYIDTALLFLETYRLIDAVRRRYGIEPRALRPRWTLAEQARCEGAELWHRDPDRCCELRKVQPLAAALHDFDAWITGLRRDSAATRGTTPLIAWSAKHQLVKLNPLAFWSERDVWRYIERHDVPYNPLLDAGYRSLGCVTCTRLPSSDDPRSGRWQGFGKTECGLHVEPA